MGLLSRIETQFLNIQPVDPVFTEVEETHQSIGKLPRDGLQPTLVGEGSGSDQVGPFFFTPSQSMVSGREARLWVAAGVGVHEETAPWHQQGGGGVDRFSVPFEHPPQSILSVLFA